jgi:multisubunit Na+/H+ antiporter MnhG subunit
MLAAVVHLLASPPASNMVSRAAYLAEGLPEGAIDEHAGAV